MHLGHSHGSHGHACHSPESNLRLNRSFAIAVVLNVLLVAGEACGGVLSGSMALLADAGHNLSDVAGLILAWWAHWLRGKGAGERWTYGFRPFTILAANINGILIVVAIIGVSAESFRRLFDASEIAETPVLIVALFAALLNFATAKLLSSGGQDLNVRGAYLHMLADAAVSMAVVVGAALMMVTKWYWVDPAISIGICVVLAFGTWGLLKESTSLMMHAVPRAVELREVRVFLEATSEVADVEDLHVWSVSTTDVLLTTRLRCPGISVDQQDALLSDVHDGLRTHFGIAHATIEIVRSRDAVESCGLALNTTNILKGEEADLERNDA